MILRTPSVEHHECVDAVFQFGEWFFEFKDCYGHFANGSFMVCPLNAETP